MKTVKVLGICALIVLGAGVMMSFATDNGVEIIKVPEGVNDKIVQVALESHMIDQRDAAYLRDCNAAQQCLDAFIGSGYDPSAVVDKIAEIGVSSGKFSNKEQVKATMKATAEKMRKNDSNWSIFYSMLGL